MTTDQKDKNDTAIDLYTFIPLDPYSFRSVSAGLISAAFTAW